MKNKTGFTLIELIIIIFIVTATIFMGIGIVSTIKGYYSNQSPIIKFKIGDTVYVDGLNITGKINRVIPDLGDDYVDLIVVGTNGAPIKLERVNYRLVKKINTLEK